MPIKEFQRLRDASVEDLVAMGVRGNTVSRHMKKWCLLKRVGAVPRLVCVDLGNLGLEGANAPSRERS